MSLQSEIDALHALTLELLHLGLDGVPIYADTFSALNAEVYRQSELLFPKKGDTLEEEASLCVTLLNGYAATIYDHGDKEQKKQSILDRSWTVLEQLPATLLKCHLLVACFAETFEEELAQEAYAIINSWEDCDLTRKDFELLEYLKSLKDDVCAD